ncbi:MAG: DUF5069 domain-containing protein [Nitrospinota bacterium]|nr:DUF5069 domain-containing protein [Nitrospinota bacterium]
MEMNLTLSPPRSPRQAFSDLVHLPRMVDKARASRQNTLGEYIYPCPLDKIMFEFLKVSSETFQQKACEETDQDITRWIDSLCQNRSPQEKEAVNQKILSSQPDTPEKWRTFNDLLNKIDASRTDISTWVDLIDLEEGRL